MLPGKVYMEIAATLFGKECFIIHVASFLQQCSQRNCSTISPASKSWATSLLRDGNLIFLKQQAKQSKTYRLFDMLISKQYHNIIYYIYSYISWKQVLGRFIVKTRIFVLKTDRAAPTIGKVPVAQKVQPIWQPTFPTRSQDHQVTNIVSLCVPNLLQPLLILKSDQGTQGTNHLSIQTTEGTTIFHWIEILPQGCRFGPESRPTPGFTNI